MADPQNMSEFLNNSPLQDIVDWYKEQIEQDKYFVNETNYPVDMHLYQCNFDPELLEVDYPPDSAISQWKNNPTYTIINGYTGIFYGSGRTYSIPRSGEITIIRTSGPATINYLDNTVEVVGNLIVYYYPGLVKLQTEHNFTVYSANLSIHRIAQPANPVNFIHRMTNFGVMTVIDPQSEQSQFWYSVSWRPVLRRFVRIWVRKRRAALTIQRVWERYVLLSKCEGSLYTRRMKEQLDAMEDVFYR